MSRGLGIVLVCVLVLFVPLSSLVAASSPFWQDAQSTQAAVSGGAWFPLGSGLGSWVSALAVDGSNVYVGGAFSYAGGDSAADRIARWDGSAWHALGAGLAWS